MHPSIWHDGERAIQRRAGVAGKIDAVGERNIGSALTEQHRVFFPKLPFLVVGTVDPMGAPWATILTEDPGFVSAPSPTTLHVAARPDADDPAGGGLQEGSAIGLLGIELATRRRNRVNGAVQVLAPRYIDIMVEQSFGNCPQYIQKRDVTRVGDVPRLAGIPRVSDAPRPDSAEEMEDLDEPALALIASTDTFFVATYMELDGQRHVDVSHRGGKSGFICADNGMLTIPDFSGNMYFVTLGNIYSNGRAGLMIVDWTNGDVLQMTGTAAVILDSPRIAAFRGAERLWTFRPQRIVRRRGALLLRSMLRDDGWSPNTLMTGNWNEAAAVIATAKSASRWRPFKIVRIVDESRSIRSFHLSPEDEGDLIPNLAGQYLAIRLELPGTVAPTVRTYSISDAVAGRCYRISVKRAGLVSAHLYDHVVVGDTVDAQAPAGPFTIDAHQTRAAVLLAGGIGITPLLAMLYHLVRQGQVTGRTRPTTLFYAAHDKGDRAFDKEIATLVATAGGALRVVRVLSIGAGAREDDDYDVLGHIDMALISRHLAFGDYDFYVCGPSGFAQALYDGLRGLNVTDDRIHAETFGSAALRRTSAVGPQAAIAGPPPAASVSTSPVKVSFVTSNKEVRWSPRSGTLLELAEAHGLAPAFACRSGNCGTCKTELLSGDVTYVAEPTAGRKDGETLICCAFPAENTDHIVLPL